MFSGLNNLFKKILPKGLFYRSLIIVAAPTILLQLIVTVVFFDSIWIKANKGMTRSLVGEIKTLSDVYNSENKSQINYITDIYKKNFDFVINSIEEPLPNEIFERRFSPMDRSLRRELKSTFGTDNYWFNTVNYLDIVEVRIISGNKNLQFFFPKERIATSSVRLFVLWITLPSILLILIAILFLKNQTRPITNLARAAEKFGKGEEIDEFKPSGASEIRQAGYEFDKMRKRIVRHLNQRSEMLSGISHDLRTPLTRMKLQIAFIKDKELSEKLGEDINEMEKMLNEYLQFTKSSFQEKDETFNLTELIDNIIKKYNNQNISMKLMPRTYYNGRKNLIKRCVNNLIDNAIKYGTKVNIELNKNNDNLFIKVEDDGPGIPEKEFDNVFKPFYKISKGRADSKSSVGLGLSIASDIIRSHGGNIRLEKSPMKGLGVKIFLPV
jgi:two-component system osmolarity sensor histidine kinase EnvZ